MSLSGLLVSEANEGSSELVSDGGERAGAFYTRLTVAILQTISANNSY